MRLFDNTKYALVLLAAGLLAVSCTKDNSTEGTIKAKSCNYFKVTPSTSSVTADGDTILLDVNANVLWTLNPGEGLTASQTSGEGKACVLIEVPENTTFDPRSFSYSISTEAELDVDDPKKWTEFGRTYNYTVSQKGMEKKFSVDRDSVYVSSAAVSARVTLTANVAFGVSCKSEDLSCVVEEDAQTPFQYYLDFSFPANGTEETIIYKAVVTPSSESFEPITIVIRQSGFRKLVIDCTNAANFRYDKSGTPTAFPTTNHGKDFVENVDFWLDGKEEYIFHGSVKNWGNTLNAAQNSKVKLPAVPGFVLSEVDVTLSYASANRAYEVYDDTKSLGKCSRSKTTSGSTVISVAASDDADRYLVCTNGEMCVKFKLTYYSID